MYYKHSLLNLYYEKYGNNRNVLIILPGWGNNRQTWNYFINTFKNYFTIYIFDYPGFGNTIFPQNNLTIFDYGKLFADFINDNQINNPVVIGHSFGGRIIILLNYFHKISFKKIIFMDSAGINNFSFKKFFKKNVYKFLKNIKFLFKDKEAYLKKLLSIFGSNDYKNIDISMQKTFINIVNTNLIKYISSIKTNTLIIWGESDTETPYKNAIKFNRLIQDSYLIPIFSCNHFPYLEYPLLINNIIYEYLKEDIY